MDVRGLDFELLLQENVPGHALGSHHGAIQRCESSACFSLVTPGSNGSQRLGNPGRVGQEKPKATPLEAEV